MAKPRETSIKEIDSCTENEFMYVNELMLIWCYPH